MSTASGRCFDEQHIRKRCCLVKSAPAREVSMDYILEMKNISKTFPGVKALDHVQLQVKPGEVHALMGENGAGKSTLMKILMGIYTKDEGGEILFNGQPYQVSNPKEAMDRGVAMIHQELNPILDMPV